MKEIKIKGGSYEITVRLNDSDLEKIYELVPERVENYVSGAIHTAFGNIFSPPELDDKIRVIDQKATKQKLELIRNYEDAKPN